MCIRDSSKFTAMKISLFDVSGSQIRHATLKKFDERSTGSKCYNSQPGVGIGGGNKDGYSIRVATADLLARREAKKVLVLLSDGLPSDYNGGTRAGLDDVRDAVREAPVSYTHLDVYKRQDQTWKDDVTANIVRSIESNLGEIFSKACTIATDYGKTGKVNTRSLNTLVRSAARVKKMNVFANPMLEQLSKSLSTITNDDMDKAEWQVEEAIVDAWNYARATGINLDMSICPFDEKRCV